MQLIAILDVVFFVASLFGLAALLRGWKNAFQRNTKLLLVALLLLTLFYSSFLALEWSGITTTLDAFEDLVGALIPMGWAFVFYAFVQERIRQDLWQSEERYRTLFEHTPVPMWVEDFSEIRARFDSLRAQGIQDLRSYLRTHPQEIAHLASLAKVVDMSQENLVFFQVSTKQEIPANLPHYFDERSLAVFKEEMIALAEGATRFEGEIPVRTMVGDKVVAFRLSVVPGYEATLSRALFSFIDITQRVQTEKALAQEASINASMAELSKALHLESSLTSISALVLGHAQDLTSSASGYVGYIDSRTGHLVCPAPTQDIQEILEMDGSSVAPQAFCGLWGWVLHHHKSLLANEPEQVVRSLGVSIDTASIHRFLSVPVLIGDQLIGQITLVNAEHDYTREDLELVERLADLYAIAVQRTRLEEQLLQVQKMEAVGRLAGGVAHDFNNHLTAITGFSELLLSELDEHDPKREDVEEIRRAAERSASLTQQLLAFSRKQVIQPQVLDLNDVIANMQNMLRRLIGEDIELVTVLAPNLGQIKGDLGQVEQIIMNLVVNARDAMPSGGKLAIETANMELNAERASEYSDIGPGSYVVLTVSDNGVGMDEKTKSHLFEPFFTTKEQGKGTGLGLATVYGIVKQSGGHVWPYSELGQGTTFRIYLPRVAQATDRVEERSDMTLSLQGLETILLAEDHDQTRKLAKRILRRQGYTVLEAHDAGEALMLCDQHQGPIHLMITDVIMPGGMSGLELAAQIATSRPEMKVLYMSGYTDNAILLDGVLKQGMNFVQKPFSPDDVARKVRKVLDGATPK